MHHGKVDVRRRVLCAEVLAGAVGPVLWRALAPGVERRPQAALGPKALLTGGHLHVAGDAIATILCGVQCSLALERVALQSAPHHEVRGQLRLKRQATISSLLLQQWAYQVPGVNALDVLGDDIDAGSGLPGPACTAQRVTHDGEVTL